MQPSADFKDIAIDMAFNTNTWRIPEVLDIVPDAYKDLLKDIKVDGELVLKAMQKEYTTNLSSPSSTLRLCLIKEICL